MRVEDLRNYGKGLMDSVPDPKGVERWREMSKAMDEELRRELGPGGVESLKAETARWTNLMKGHDWSVLRERGLVDEGFIDGIIQRIGVMRALADMVGMEKATEIQCKLLDMTMYDLMAPMWPSVEEYKACGDFFESFKQYFKASMAANVRAGLHEMEIVEDTASALAFNIKYCAWHEVAKGFGDPYLCYPSTCYGDEVTISRVLGPVGYRFKRAGTLATGAPVCDFRYELFAGGDTQGQRRAS